MPAAAYSWYEDNELLALLDRYMGGAADGASAGRRLKVWLARSDAPTPMPEPATAVPAPATAHAAPDADGYVWLSRSEAAARTGISAKTLANYGEHGPPYDSWPSVRYRQDLLDAWVADRKRSGWRRGRPRRSPPAQHRDGR